MSLIKSDREKRIKTLKRKIKKLGILDMHYDGGNTDNLTAYEQIVGVVEEHQKEYPPRYEAAMLDFIKAVRENVWKHGDKFSCFYFDVANIIFWGLKSLRYKPEFCRSISEKILDVEKLFNVFTKHENK